MLIVGIIDYTLTAKSRGRFSDVLELCLWHVLGRRLQRADGLRRTTHWAALSTSSDHRHSLGGVRLVKHVPHGVRMRSSSPAVCHRPRSACLSFYTILSSNRLSSRFNDRLYNRLDHVYKHFPYVPAGCQTGWTTLCCINGILRYIWYF